jgi:hypothetical protein
MLAKAYEPTSMHAGRDTSESTEHPENAYWLIVAHMGSAMDESDLQSLNALLPSVLHDGRETDARAMHERNADSYTIEHTGKSMRESDVHPLNA